MNNLKYYTIIFIVTFGFYTCKKSFEPISIVSPKIAYLSSSASHWDIYIMDMDGSNKVNLTNGRYYWMEKIRFFPDGEKIVFDYYELDSNIDGIGVIDLEGNIVLETGNLSSYYRYLDFWNPFVSPNGLYIGFIHGTNLPGAIFTVNMKTKDFKLMTPFNDHYYSLDFTSDGNSIIYGNTGLWSQDINDSSIVKISDIPGLFHKFTPDGSKIVFQKNEYFYWEPLCIMDSNGENVRELADNFDPRYRFDISSDGSKIAYTGENQIYIINNDGTNQVCLTDTLGGWDPQISSDGEKIIYTSGIHSWDVYIMDVNGSNHKNLTLDGGYDNRYPIFQSIY